MLAMALLALPACHKQQQAQAQNQDMSPDQGVAENQLPANADIETLPADESSATPSNQLQDGADNPDVNSLSNTQ
ncbi:MAG TPA: hypothetical protein VIV07_06850 [Sphingomicrobium sp.]